MHRFVLLPVDGGDAVLGTAGMRRTFALAALVLAAAVGFVVARAEEPDAVRAVLAPGGGLGEDGRRVIVIAPDGGRVGHGPAARTAPPVPARDLTLARSRTAAVETESGGARIVLQAVPAAGGGTAVIQYWSPGGLAPGTRALWTMLAAPAVLAVAGAGAAGHRFGARGARLVGRFGRAAAAVRGGDAVVRIDPSGPAELREAATAFNTMSERAAGRLAAERRTAGDLPHRLRTPLAALRLRVDRLAGGDREDAAREALDRLEQEVDLLIQAARVPGVLSAGTGCDAAEVVAERAEYWSALDGVPLDLTPREFELLAYLASRPGEVVSRAELRREVWRQPYGAETTVDVHLSWLRRKLGEAAAAPRRLHTVRGGRRALRRSRMRVRRPVSASAP